MMNFISCQLFPIIFNMSVTGGLAICLVLVVRLALRKAPRVFSYALWGVALFRLLCPVSFTAGFSPLALFDPPTREVAGGASSVEYVQPDMAHTELPGADLPLPGVSGAVNGALPQGGERLAAGPLEAPAAIAAWVWLLGILALLVYGGAALLSLRRRLVGAVPLRDNIYLADHIDTPFVLGILRPRICLPSSLTEGERVYIIEHERHHIRRGDHLAKLLAFAALCVHWFNPLVWAAFLLSARDMEMSCDEAVVRRLGEGIRRDYSASLLKLSTGRSIIGGAPLAFGEGDTGSRVKHLMAWKRPKARLTAIAAVLCLAVTAACAANPAPSEVPPEDGPDPALLADLPENSANVIIGADALDVIWESADLDRDGQPERVRVGETMPDQLYTLEVVKGDGAVLWSWEAGIPHVGWNSLFLYSDDSGDYLLQYSPHISTGLGSYQYTLFSLEGGRPTVYRELTFDFEVRELWEDPDIAAGLLDFRSQVNAYLRESTLLLSTLRGQPAIGPAAGSSHLDALEDLAINEEMEALEEALRAVIDTNL